MATWQRNPAQTMRNDLGRYVIAIEETPEKQKVETELNSDIGVCCIAEMDLRYCVIIPMVS